MTSDRTFSRIFGGLSLEYVNLGLIEVKKGFDARKVARDLNMPFRRTCKPRPVPT